jgi:hypothetical protein
MGRPQKQLERDGSPVREFAFWLRDLRNHSGLTYQELAMKASYATSTLQEAAAGQRLPTLRLLAAFVTGCDGDLEAWRAYWTQLRRILDPDAPRDMNRSVAPPWAPDPGPAPDSPCPEGYYVESFTALLRLDAEPIEAEEQRVVVATVDGLSGIATSISVPRRPDDTSLSHDLDADLLHGGSLESREQPWESYFRNVIALPEPLDVGERHQYALRLRIPPGQPMAQHYVHVPFRRSDYFDLRVRFDPRRPPRAVWTLSGTPTAVIYERGPVSSLLIPDRFGEIHVTFSGLSVGLAYGVCWQE